MNEIMKIDARAASVVRELHRVGHQAYLVGGCVRDFLLGKDPKDWDIATSATPEEVTDCFADAPFPVIGTGLKHGTVSVIIDGMPIEVTTFRVDGAYTDNRHPADVTFVRDLKEDLSRRDFTMNALAYDLESGVIDYFEGASDLAARRIRAVGDPDLRLKEDALRILRALRFSAVLSFGIDPALAGSIRKNKDLLQNISRERISSELSKMLVGDNIGAVLLAYPDVFSVFLPEIAPAIGFAQKSPYHIYDVWTHTAHSVAFAVPDLLVRLTLLFHDLGKPTTFSVDQGSVGHFYQHNKYSEEIAARRLRELRFDNETIAAIRKLVRWHDAQIPPGNLTRWLNKLGEDGLRRLFQVKKADNLAQNESLAAERIRELDTLEHELNILIQSGPCYTLKDLAVSGKDILDLGVPPGSEVGRILRLLLAKVIDSELENDRDTLLDFIDSIAAVYITDDDEDTLDTDLTIGWTAGKG